MMNLVARTPSLVSSSTSVSPGKKHHGSQDPWKSVAEEDRSGRLDKGTDLFEASDHHYHEQFMESSSSTNHSKLDDDRAWSSQQSGTEATTYDRSGRPDKISWRMVRKVRPVTRKFFSTELRNPSGTEKHFVTDRGDLIISILKKWQDLKNFVMGDDGTELELSVESRSFVNRVSDQVRKRQKKFQCYRRWRRTFYDLWNVYGCNNGISSIHGKVLPEQLSIHCEHDGSHT